MIQKKKRKKIFNYNSAAMYINIDLDVGKIIKVSKNMTAVLGFQR